MITMIIIHLMSLQEVYSCNANTSYITIENIFHFYTRYRTYNGNHRFLAGGGVTILLHDFEVSVTKLYYLRARRTYARTAVQAGTGHMG